MRYIARQDHDRSDRTDTWQTQKAVPWVVEMEFSSRRVWTTGEAPYAPPAARRPSGFLQTCRTRRQFVMVLSVGEPVSHGRVETAVGAASSLCWPDNHPLAPIQHARAAILKSGSIGADEATMLDLNVRF